MDSNRRRLLAGGGCARRAPARAVTPAAMAGPINSLRAGLRELGYIEGKTIRIEYRWAEGRYETRPSLAADLVKQKVALSPTG